jgi:hypothetical protein
MIGHDRTRVNINAGIEQWDFILYGLHHTARVIQTHNAIHHILKQADAILADDSYKIGAGTGVIIIAQAYGPAVVAVGIISHGFLTVGATPYGCPIPVVARHPGQIR